MQTLDPISIPLNQASLIEASAGTGKTYTMANLYLRLILGVGCEPLSVEQILVVTFTKAATQELRDRIRAKLKDVANWFAEPESEAAQQAFCEPFMAELYQAVQPKLAEALLRLRIAEREMDLATIFTIDSFCQKMLFQYAFDSGVRLDIELNTDESELLQQLSEQTWRELFYPASFAETQLVARLLGSPQLALAKVKPYLSQLLPAFDASQQAWLAEEYSEQAVRFEQFLATARAYWREHRSDIIAPLQQAFEQQVQQQCKILDGRVYKADSFQHKWLPEIDGWAAQTDWHFPEKVLSYFSQSVLASKASKGATVLTSPHFERWDDFLAQYAPFRDISAQIERKLLYRYFLHLQSKLQQYKQQHTEKNFDDILRAFHQTLYAENGHVLVAKIRQQFGFAMMDESQDTNQIQYQIFKRLFLAQGETQGFILIGDPKQSIYKFRGADIFSYLDAANAVAGKYTLAKNWRSLPQVVTAINQLFQLPESAPPFIYPEIGFSPVASHESAVQLCTPHQAVNVYLLSEAYNTAHFDVERAAEHCAEQICQQLLAAQQGQLWLVLQQGDEKVRRSLEPKDIAILVRSHSEAARIKRSLSARNLQSVFLSEKRSVFATQEARDLALVLKACLTPFSQKAVLAAMGSALWGLTGTEIYRLKHNEQAWESCVAAFLAYQQCWQSQGILPMLHQLLIQQQIVARLNTRAESDRRLTNILHLAELLQQQMAVSETEASLLRWLQQQIQQPTEQRDEQILRLESEAALIKIITIHKSKGLEYPVVWLPFIGKGVKGAKTEAMPLYRDEQQQLRWALDGGNEQINQLRNQAEYAEELRLLYVALTRAKYQLHLILPEIWAGSWNAMHYLLSNGTLTKQGSTSAYLENKAIAHHRVRLVECAEVTPFDTPQQGEPVVQARSFHTKIRETGQITSFTQLQAQHERLQNLSPISPLAILSDEALDYDSTSVATVFTEAEEPTIYSPYQFPHSTKVGNVLHRFLERLDFTQPIDTTAIQPICDALNLSSDWLEPVQHWFCQVLQTPFTDQAFCLAQIPVHKRLNEWQFYLRLRNRHALPQLNRLLKQHSRLAPQLADLQLLQLDGFVRGFVDCLVEVDQRFYLLDYKSNFLGYFAEDYLAEKIEKTMGQFRYDLQYLLYTLAVHRYLRSRLGKAYQYSRDFGGVAYLFLRGMNGTAHRGVYFDKPSATLIEAMDQLFD